MITKKPKTHPNAITTGSLSNWPKEVIIYTDGASRGNPGDASYGVSVQDASNQTLFEEALFIGSETNNVAEYQGVKRALELVAQSDIQKCQLKTDSQLVVKQLKGEYKVKAPQLKSIYQECLKLIQKIPDFSAIHVRRECNQRADELANIALDQPVKKNLSYKELKIIAIQTELFSPNHSLSSFLIDSLSSYSIKENMVLAISSKLFSLAENQIIQKENKEKLIQKEADYYLGKNKYGFHLTIKQGVLLPSSGIDESNSPTGGYLLFPKNPYASLENLWNVLRKKWSLKNLGLLMTDSHTTPLRRGVSGVSIAHWGFQAVSDQRGETDLYGRKLQVTTINHVDALASSAVWMMGEGSNRCPLVVIEGADLQWTTKSSLKEIQIDPKEDLYFPLFKKWFS